VELVKINEHGVKLNDKIALIDADTIAYISAAYSEVQVDDDAWEANISHGLEIAEAKIKDILGKTGCERFELYFTGSTKQCFRYKLYPSYKSNRKTRAPEGLNEIKQELASCCGKYLDGFEYGEVLSTIEADDMVVYRKREFSDKYILCAVDKDVLNSLAGTHFNYYEAPQYNKHAHFIETDQLTAIKWPYLQCIMGDSGDGVPGVPGMGVKRASAVLEDAKTEEEMWAQVVKAYETKGLSEADAIITMNIVNMHLYDGEKVRRWLPNFEGGRHVL
jgi:DNA polymerase-1